ncbi:MAG TPA: DUF6786 family protein [Planctomycetota bacterium]|nr:DUF6786 family protein [Planctomycetota bacterium]
MKLRMSLAAASIALGGCVSQTFINDVNFLTRHTEVLVIAPDRTSSAQIAICPELQGRVITSTASGPGGLSYGWINRDLIASGEKRRHINAYGGEDRFWLGPEGGQFSFFFTKGDPQDLSHWQTPAPVDSEPFDVARRSGDSVLLRKKMRLLNTSGTTFELEVQREIRALGGNDPGKMLGIQPTSYVRWVGYESRNKITNTGDSEWKRDTGLLSAWILGMFNPSPEATIVIPYKEGPEEKLGPVVNDAYFGKVPGNRLKVTPGVLYFRGDGLFRSKIGLSPRRSLGVLGCYDAENETLTVVQFRQPKGATDYVNSMWEIQKDPYSGDAVNSYNDGPASPGASPLGPFYELESSSPALALKPGLAYTHVHTTFHFQGPVEELDQIAVRVFGVGLAQITTAFPP